MKYHISSSAVGLEKRIEDRGISRRGFLKFCATVAAAMGLGPNGAEEVMAALASPQRPPVVWLAMSECTGCAEALLRTYDPFIDVVLLDTIDLAYHETIMQASGDAAEKALYDTVEKYKGQFIAIVDGSIPTAENGIYGWVGGHTMLDIAKDILPKAAHVIAVGTCSSYGGLPAAKPNPTGAKSVQEATGIKTINVPGCPPNPVPIVGSLVHLITKGVPELDANGRPLVFFGKTVHEDCPRLKHFEAGEFAKSFDSDEAKKGWCLYELGCRGPVTYNVCSRVKFNMHTSWPVQAGHPCIGCSEPNFWDDMSPFYVGM